jgi:hypothetical protein
MLKMYREEKPLVPLSLNLKAISAFFRLPRNRLFFGVPRNGKHVESKEEREEENENQLL